MAVNSEVSGTNLDHMLRITNNPLLICLVAFWTLRERGFGALPA